MAVIRSFIAVDLPDALNTALEKASKELQQELSDSPVRWVPVNNIHLTLKFLGDVSDNNIPVLQTILRTEAANHHIFEVSIGGFGVFPNAIRPRVLWVGVEAPDELMSLQRRIDMETARLGYAPDQRPFNPHLTLGRVSRNASPAQVRKIGDFLKKHKIGFLGAARIETVTLYRSDLSPSGAVYSKIKTAKLAD
ncbi:RNA 2',3'-cyclic phosphodiesterase [bacterium]|nr:RNA 2',3'-cyclic phosphodiesterase [bacterium]MCB2179422.1 RNA 2',3'-cyclic phosphodiesterase [bacterium]